MSTESSQPHPGAPTGTSEDARTRRPGRVSSRKLAAREVEVLRKLEEAFTLAEFDFQGFAGYEGGSLSGERFSRVLKEWLSESPFEVSIYAGSVHDEAKKMLLAQELIVNLEAESQFEEAKKWRRYLEGVQEESDPR